MCGRLTLTRSGDEIAAYFAEAMATLDSLEGPRELDGSPLRPRFNVSPARDVLTLVPTEAGAGFAWKRWGLVPSWATDPGIGNRTFNARAETVAEKPSFRAAFKRRRCLVAADGFYEWTPRNRDHRPFLFTPRRAALLGFAGLFESWTGEGGEVIESATVITTDANPDMDGIHHRMPVIVDPADHARWLDPATEKTALLALLRPASPGTLDRRPVTRYVNDPRHEGPRCLEDEEKAEQGALFPLADDESDSEDEEF